MSNSKKKKVATTVVATTLTAAVLLAGTYAWQNLNQEALNVAADTANPGGRLHDDFDGRNKDVYVENFADQPIYARIQLTEYMEKGSNAGINLDDTAENRSVEVITTGADYNDKSTWPIHYYSADNATDTYWTWSYGGETVYMPTFNLNQDSLEAEINGTYDGLDATDNIHYDDYVKYAEGDTLAGYEIEDLDDNSDDEGENAAEGVNIVTSEERTHTAKATGTANVISMEEWASLTEEEKETAYWVYDTDGWAYYSKAIDAGTATGLLLDGIELTGTVGDSWYYAINVIAQFITANDVGILDGTGFYDTSKGTVPTTDAENFLTEIGVTIDNGDATDTPVVINMTADSQAVGFYYDTVYQYFNTDISNRNYNFTAEIELDSGATVEPTSVTWSFAENGDHYTVKDGTDDYAGLKVAHATQGLVDVYSEFMTIAVDQALATIDPTTGDMKLLLDPEPHSQTYYIEATAEYDGETWVESVPVFIRSTDINIMMYDSEGNVSTTYTAGQENVVTVDPELTILGVEQDDTKVTNWGLKTYNLIEEGEVETESTVATYEVQTDGTCIVTIPPEETADIIVVAAEYEHDGSTDGLLSDIYRTQFRITKVTE